MLANWEDMIDGVGCLATVHTLKAITLQDA
jgi:hypothetical protein